MNSSNVSLTRAGTSAALYIAVMGGVSVLTGGGFDLSGLSG